VRKYNNEEDSKENATQCQVEDNANMVVEDGWNLNEGREGIPAK